MRAGRLFGVGLILAVVLTAVVSTGAAVSVPDPAVDDSLSGSAGESSAVLAGGCFWGVEEVFQHVRGVTSATSGFAGGAQKNPKYELVSTGTTGHAESVKIVFDPSQISYGQLLKVFFAVAHDPTQKGGQGPDIGPQYRSAIFFNDDRQRTIAAAYLDQLRTAQVFGKKTITTQLAPLTGFYEAEAFHQDFAARNPSYPYILMFDRPKIEKLKKDYPQLYVK